MRRTCVVAWIVVLVGVVAADEKELPKLDGTWVWVSETNDGKKTNPEELKGYSMNFKSGKLTSMLKGKVQDTSSYKVDASRTPAQLDMTVEDGALKGQTSKGIFKIDGDKLIICYGGVGADRPATFESTIGSNNTLWTLQKQKADE